MLGIPELFWKIQSHNSRFELSSLISSYVFKALPQKALFLMYTIIFALFATMNHLFIMSTRAITMISCPCLSGITLIILVHNVFCCFHPHQLFHYWISGIYSFFVCVCFYCCFFFNGLQDYFRHVEYKLNCLLLPCARKKTCCYCACCHYQITQHKNHCPLRKIMLSALSAKATLNNLGPISHCAVLQQGIRGK